MVPLLDAELAHDLYLFQIVISLPRYEVYFFEKFSLMMLQFTHDASRISAMASEKLDEITMGPKFMTMHQ